MENSNTRRGQRLESSKPSVYLCYECGDMFMAKLPYDEHILVHQAVSLCHQIYYFETNGQPSNTAPHRSFDTANRDPSNVRSSRKEESSKERGRPSTSARIQSRRSTTTGVPPQKRAYHHKRKMTAPLPDSLTCLTTKRPVGRPRAEWRNHMRPQATTDKRAPRPVVALSDHNATNNQDRMMAGNSNIGSSQLVSVPTSGPTNWTAEGGQSTLSLQGAPYMTDVITENTSKDIQQYEHSAYQQSGGSVQQMSMASPQSNESPANGEGMTGGGLTSTRVNEEDGGKFVKEDSTESLMKLGAQMAVQNRCASPNTMAQKCLLCDYRSCQGWEMVEHIVREHKVSIAMVEKTAFEHGQWTPRETLLIGEKCNFCPRMFSDATDMYLHIIVCHRNSMFTSEAKRLNCVVHMAHPNLPIQRINITMRRP